MKANELFEDRLEDQPYLITNTEINGKLYVVIKTTEPRGIPMQVMVRLAYDCVDSYTGKIKKVARDAGIQEVRTLAGSLVSKKMGSSFKPVGLIFRVSDPNNKEKIVALLQNVISVKNKQAVKKEKWKIGASKRKKEASKYNAIAQKKRLDALYNKYGKDIVDRVKIRQVGGDDGYQYNVFVDGRSVMNGLTRPSAEHERTKIWTKLSKEKMWNTLTAK